MAVFAIGGYSAALLFNKMGFTDALGLTLAGGVMATLIAAPFAPLLARYRGIFFAMLTLALSMVTYGLGMKVEVLGGSDGFNVGRATLLGWRPPDAQVGYVLYLVTVGVATVMALLGLDPRRLDIPGRRRLEMDLGQPIQAIMA